MRDGHRWTPDGGEAVAVRDMPSEVIAESLFDGFQIINNYEGIPDPVYWLRIRLEAELIRRALGLEIR